MISCPDRILHPITSLSSILKRKAQSSSREVSKRKAKQGRFSLTQSVERNEMAQVLLFRFC